MKKSKIKKKTIKHLKSWYRDEVNEIDSLIMASYLEQKCDTEYIAKNSKDAKNIKDLYYLWGYETKNEGRVIYISWG